jgi:hypothetical protein
LTAAGITLGYDAGPGTIRGRAKFMTGEGYLHFSSYYSNVSMDKETGNLSGYAFSDDLGWIDFGQSDNPSGPVNVNLTTGSVSGKAYVITSGSYVDFTSYGSNVKVDLSTGVFSGYAWSEDAGWVDFSDTGVYFPNNTITTYASDQDLILDPEGNGITRIIGKLGVSDTQNSTYIASLNNLSTSTAADGLLIALGTDSTRGTGNVYIGFAYSGSTVAGRIVGNGAAVTYETTGADYAEYFLAEDIDNKPEPGDIVSISKIKSQGVKKAVSPEKAIGVISDAAGFIGNGPICDIDDENCDENYKGTNVIVGISGQIYTKVSTENGSISLGDPLTTSDMPGVAVKAIKSGNIIGHAMEIYTEEDPTIVGKIKIYVNPGWYDINAVQEMLTDVDIEESTESTESVSPEENATGIMAQMQQMFEEFKTLLTTLGMVSHTDEDGRNYLSIDSDVNMAANLSVLGKTTTSDLTVTGNIQAGMIKIDTIENSINVLGIPCYNPETGETNEECTETSDQTLYLQRTLSGNLDVFNGKLVIEPNGMMKLDGSIEVSGTVKAQDVQTKQIVIDSPEVASASAGKATIPQGETSITITTTAVTDNSLIMVTPERPVAIGSKYLEDGKFEITLKEPEGSDLQVSWFILKNNIIGQNYDNTGETHQN